MAAFNNLNVLRVLFSKSLSGEGDDAGNKLLAKIFPMTVEEISRVRKHYKW